MATVIGVLGSPIAEGNTGRLLDRAMAGAKDAGCETRLIIVTALDFQSCQEMYFCRDHESCIFNDDLNTLYPEFATAEGLILATPLMTMGIPGPLKSFIDRFQVFFMAKYFRKQPLVPAHLRAIRKGLFIGISGMNKPGGFDGTKQTIRAFFDIIDCHYQDELLVPGMDMIRDIGIRPDLLDAAYKKGYDLGGMVSRNSPPGGTGG